MLVDALATRWPRESVVAALGRAALVCRGPKPVAVLKELALRPRIAVPEPTTWRDVLAALDRELPVRGLRVAVQEYGKKNPELLAGLAERGASVTAVPVYGYTLPDDTAPLERAVRRLAAGDAEVAMFTTAQHLNSLFTVAERLGLAPAVHEALARRVLVASIGPVTNEALTERGLAADVVPEHPKMGHLVKAVATEGPARLAAKRR
jgi:uroporphyrinogen-III synthase